jgi:hypothetical protein
MYINHLGFGEKVVYNYSPYKSTVPDFCFSQNVNGGSGFSGILHHYSTDGSEIENPAREVRGKTLLTRLYPRERGNWVRSEQMMGFFALPELNGCGHVRQMDRPSSLRLRAQNSS